jgi:mRNA-degrading endonuclease toxin of MazEF toxin-antitoxin module
VSTRLPKPGEIWQIDFGMRIKPRPALIFTAPLGDDARVLYIVAPLTSQIRGMRGEVEIGRPPGLEKTSAVNLQGLGSIVKTDVIRYLTKLSDSQFLEVKAALRELLEL